MLNKRLLRRVRNQIAAEPKQFVMEAWFDDVADWKIPNCGTAACIGGWALALNANKRPSVCSYEKPDESARRVLRLTNPQKHALLAIAGWPDNYQASWMKLRGTAGQRARVAVRLLDALLDGKMILTSKGEWKKRRA